MRGWVYIITTKSMPELLKVGFTLKDPDIRAKELGRTGLPHPYKVEYEVFVNQPRQLEKAVHDKLDKVREGREWFRCSTQMAILVIQEIAASHAILERDRRTIEPTSQPIRKPKKVHCTRSNETSLPKQNVFNRTARYKSKCEFCDMHYSVTLTRYDSAARCPHCQSVNDVTEFLKQVFSNDE